MSFTQLLPRFTPADSGLEADLGDHGGFCALTSEQTGGAFSLNIMWAHHNAAPPPHVHTREDETFYILEGCFAFWVDGQTLTAGPGDTVFAPRNIPHVWRCISEEGGKAMVLISPGGFERFFLEVDTLRASNQLEPARMLELMQAYGLEMVSAVK